MKDQNSKVAPNLFGTAELPPHQLQCFLKNLKLSIFSIIRATKSKNGHHLDRDSTVCIATAGYVRSVFEICQRGLGLHVLTFVQPGWRSHLAWAMDLETAFEASEVTAGDRTAQNTFAQ